MLPSHTSVARTGRIALVTPAGRCGTPGAPVANLPVLLALPLACHRAKRGFRRVCRSCSPRGFAMSASPQSRAPLVRFGSMPLGSFRATRVRLQPGSGPTNLIAASEVLCQRRVSASPLAGYNGCWSIDLPRGRCGLLCEVAVEEPTSTVVLDNSGPSRFPGMHRPSCLPARGLSEESLVTAKPIQYLWVDCCLAVFVPMTIMENLWKRVHVSWKLVPSTKCLSSRG